MDESDGWQKKKRKNKKNKASQESGVNPKINPAALVERKEQPKKRSGKKTDQPPIPPILPHTEDPQIFRQGKDTFKAKLYPPHFSESDIEKLVKFGVVSSGTVRISQKNNKRAYITSPGKKVDVLIEGLYNRNRALDGDEVYYITRRGHEMCQNTGTVIRIKTMNHGRGGAGTIDPIVPKSDFALFVPNDTRIPKMIILKKNWPAGINENSDFRQGVIFYGIIRQWTEIRYAEGMIIGVADEINRIDIATAKIVMTLAISRFDEYVKSFIPSVPHHIKPEEEKSREDFRRECVFTIDPTDAADLQSAISCKSLKNGNYQVGVHVADVSFFLRQGTPLDSIVRERGSCVYLVNKTYHLLPYDLRKICYLTPGYDRLTLSVIYEFTPAGLLVSNRITRSIVNSCAQFSHAQVDEIICKGISGTRYPPIHGRFHPKYIGNLIRALHKITTHLREKRQAHGAFSLYPNKITYNLLSNGLPLSYEINKVTESHFMVQELMVLTNATVARKIYSYFPTIALLRICPPPAACHLEQSKMLLGQYGVELDTSSSTGLNASLAKYSGSDVQDVATRLVIENLLAPLIPRAKYYCKEPVKKQKKRAASGAKQSQEPPTEPDKKHYRVGMELYTHFTSPITRYADIIVHRLLSATFRGKRRPRWSPKLVKSIVDHCNEKQQSARKAEKLSEALYLDVWLTKRPPALYDAVVFYINNLCFKCLLLETGSRHTVYFTSYDGETTVTTECGVLKLFIIWPETDTREEEKQVLELFSIVKVMFSPHTEEENLKAILWRED